MYFPHDCIIIINCTGRQRKDDESNESDCQTKLSFSRLLFDLFDCYLYPYSTYLNLRFVQSIPN